jgi:hypothetical protein
MRNRPRESAAGAELCDDDRDRLVIVIDVGTAEQFGGSDR